jgi:hypothetical protein
MKKSYLCLLCGFCIYCTGFSQQQPIQLKWLNTALEYYNGGDFIANGVTNLSDGSTVVVGYFKNTVDFDPGPDTFSVSTKFQFDLFLARYSSKGKLIFAFGLSGSGDQPYASASAVTADVNDNIYVTGSFYGNIDFDGGKGKAILNSTFETSNFIACYTIKGELKFAENITSPGGAAKSIALDKNKNIYITGSFQGYNVDFDPGPNATHINSNESDIFFAKYDSACNFKFVKILEGKKYDLSNKIALDKNNDIIICGNFSSTYLDADPDSTKKYVLTRKSDRDLFFAKYDTSGNLIFAKNIGNYKSNEARGIAVGTDNSIVLTGQFNGISVDFDPSDPGKHLLTSHNSYDAFVAKYDASGNCIFAFTIGNGSAYDNGVDIDLDSSNNIFCTGEFGGSNVDFNPGNGVYKIPASKEGDYYLAKYTYTGNIVSAVAIGGQFINMYSSDFQINSLHVTSTGNTLIAGFFYDKVDLDAGPDSAIVSEPTNTMFVCKYDNANNFLTEVHGDNYYSYYSNTVVTNSAIDKAGNMYVCGRLTGRFDFDPGPGTYLLESFSDSIEYSSNDAGFIAKYSVEGNFIFAKAIKGGETVVNDIAVDDNENIYIAGKASAYTDFDPGNGVYYLNNKPVDNNFYYTFYFAKYDANGNLIFAKGNGSNSNFLNVTSLAIDARKGICIGGAFDDLLDFDPGPNQHILDGGNPVGNMFLAKYDSLGKYVFANCIKSNDNLFGYGVVNDLQFDTKNNIIFTGTFHGTNFDFNAGPGEFLLSSDNTYDAGFISKYKNNGAFVSAIEIKGQDYSYSDFSHLTTDNSGNIYIAGSSRNIADFDPGPGTAFLSQYYEMFFASYDSKLQFRFLKGLLGYGDFTESNDLSTITADKYSNIYVAGRFTSNKIDCDPGADSALLVNIKYGNYYTSNLFIAKYDSLGSYIYSNQFRNDSAGSSNLSASIFVGHDGTLYYSGSVNGKVNFATGNKKVYLQPTTMYNNMFVAQYKQTTTQSKISNVLAESKAVINNAIKVYPNPITDYLNIELTGLEQKATTATIRLYDIKGRCLQTDKTSFSNHNLNTVLTLPKNLSAGNYFIRVDVDRKAYYSDVLIK